ncbi:MAG: cytochrome B6 [Deltaproteobacteria bacterium]|nr:cytochrome B6 [Deltaproteobacteria bacterium]
MRIELVGTLAVVGAAVAWVGWWPTAAPPESSPTLSELVDEGRGGPLRPLAPLVDLDPKAVALGRRLFGDPRLSANRKVSCASCHHIPSGGDDARKISIGIGGVEGSINAPTVIGAALNSTQFWDGRAPSLEAQVGGPIENPLEMGSSWPAVLEAIGRDPEYVAQFEALFGGVTQAGVESAIADYERTLIPVGNRFDRYLSGDTEALSAQERHGYDLFVSYGCASCHQGANVGGNLFQKLGVARDYFAEQDRPVTRADLGRFNVTGRADDKHVFRVPSLRMVSQTAPYFHDGSAASLDEAVAVMARFQLGREIPVSERVDVVAFLVSLGAEVQP